MEPLDVHEITVDGQFVYYMPEEVVAIGADARDFVMHVQPDPLPVVGDPTDRSTSGASREPSFRITNVADPVQVVAEARRVGLSVQLNHVLFAHCGCGCDPCCADHANRANPYWANPYWANPYWANPYWANAQRRTSAVAAAARTLPGTGGGRTGPVVWVLDTGLDRTGTSAFAGRGVGGADGDAPDQMPGNPPDGLVDPVAGHGTFIAGIIERLAPGCRLVVEDVMRPEGMVIETKVQEAILALLQSTSNQDLQQTILNLSFGGALSEPGGGEVGNVIAAAQELGVVVVASAGNGATCRPTYPANLPGVVAVGAVDQSGKPAAFTNVGSWIQTCALGVDVVSTFFEFQEQAPTPPHDPLPQNEQLQNFQKWAIWSGTSFAAPVVVGAIAKHMIDNPEESAADARKAVLSVGDEVSCLGRHIRPDGLDELIV